MKYYLGNYVLDNVEVTFTEQPVRIANSLVRLTVLTHNVKCKLRSDTQTGLDTLIAEAMAALRGPGGDVGLYLEDGTPTQHVIIAADTLDGIKLTSGPNFPQGAGAEYSLFRTMDFTLVAEIKNPNLNLIQFQETFSGSGGTRPTSWLLPADGSDPISQRLVRTPAFITQSGSAETYLPGFIVPLALNGDPDEKSLTITGPEAAAGKAGTWKYKWSYRMSTAKLTAVPTPDRRIL